MVSQKQKLKHKIHKTVLYLIWSRSVSKGNNIDNNSKMKLQNFSKQTCKKGLMQEKVGG